MPPPLPSAEREVPGVASIVKSPRLTMCDTSRSGSWTESGSVPMLQSSVPAARRAALTSDWVASGSGRLEQGDGAGHVGSRHRGARDVGVAVARHGRPDALARRDQVDVPAVVGEIGERVVDVVRAPRVAQRAVRRRRACRPCRRAPRPPGVVVAGRLEVVGVEELLLPAAATTVIPASNHAADRADASCPCCCSRSCRRRSPGLSRTC